MKQTSPVYSLSWFLDGNLPWSENLPINRRNRGTFEDHLIAIKNYCKSQAVIYDIPNSSGGTIVHKPNNCNSWDCESCRKKKAFSLKSRIQAGIVKQSWRLLTLTLDPKTISLADSLRRLSHLWDIFSKALRRNYPDLKYIKVIEFHKSGYPHLHIIFNKYIPKAQISKLWVSRGGGEIIDIKQIKTKQIANYISGYLSHKDKKHHEHDHQFYDNSLRRFSFSRNFPLAPWEKRTISFCSGLDWDCSHDIFDNIIKIFYLSGAFFAVTKENEVKYINMHSNSYKITKC